VTNYFLSVKLIIIQEFSCSEIEEYLNQTS